MKTRSIALCLAMIVISLLTVLNRSAAAQGSTWTGESLAQMVESARWHLGALRINASLGIASAGFDTDIYYGYFETPTPDVTITASAPIQILAPFGKKVVLEFSDSPQYLFFLKTKRERAWNNILQGRFHVALEKLYAQVGGGQSNVRTRLSPELDINIRQIATTLDGSALWQFSNHVSLAALYGFARYTYGSSEVGEWELASSLNRHEHLIDLATYIQSSTRVRLFINGQYGHYAFSESAMANRDARSYCILGGITFVPQKGELGPIERPQGSISLGIKRLDMIDSSRSDGSGVVGAIDVSAGLIEKTTASARFSRDFAFSIYSDGTFYLSTSFGGGISRQLSRKTILSYAVTSGWSGYPEEVGADDNRNYRFTSHTISLGVRISRYLRASLMTSLGKRTRGNLDSPKHRNFFGLSLVYGVPSSSISAPIRGLSR